MTEGNNQHTFLFWPKIRLSRMTPKTSPMETMHPRHFSRAFSLIEVTLALGLAGICLFTLMALFANCNSVTSETISQLEAAGIASKIRLQMAQSLSRNGTKVLYENITKLPKDTPVEISDLLCDASGQATTSPALAKYKVAVSIHPPAGLWDPGVTLNFSPAYPTSVKISWPANAKAPSHAYELLFALVP